MGFYNAALNIGVSAGAIFPWGTGSLNRPLYLRERFFMGGNSSPVCSFGGPISILGFKSSGHGLAEPQSQVIESANSESSNSSGDLAVTAFVDLSFDLPLKLFRDAGIHGHAFACAGNLDRLTENTYRDLSLQKFQESYKASAGFGIIVPLKRFRMEVCHRSSALQSPCLYFLVSLFLLKVQVCKSHDPNIRFKNHNFLLTC